MQNKKTQHPPSKYLLRKKSLWMIYGDMEARYIYELWEHNNPGVEPETQEEYPDYFYKGIKHFNIIEESDHIAQYICPVMQPQNQYTYFLC